MITFEVLPERDGLGGWRVEALDMEPDGLVLCASFWGGADSESRAREYAEWMNSHYGNRGTATAA